MTGGGTGPPPSRMTRLLLRALGGVCVGIGLIGVVVPGLPTTIFMIAALWAFSRSSPRFEAWLLNHPRFGPPLRTWREERAIPIRAKRLATLAIAVSWVIIVLTTGSVWIAFLAAAGLGAVLAFLWTRPEPSPAAAGSDHPGPREGEPPEGDRPGA